MRSETKQMIGYAIIEAVILVTGLYLGVQHERFPAMLCFTWFTLGMVVQLRRSRQEPREAALPQEPKREDQKTYSISCPCGSVFDGLDDGPKSVSFTCPICGKHTRWKCENGVCKEVMNGAV